jgi:hypothetical protein
MWLETRDIHVFDCDLKFLFVIKILFSTIQILNLGVQSLNIANTKFLS